MKILVFSDLHGSLNSLKALISSQDFKEADKAIFLGDVTFGCSRPNECIDLLLKSNIICVLGNNDSYIAYNHIPDKDLHTFDEIKHIQMRYMLDNVSEKNKKIMQTWNKELYLELNDKSLYFVHYPWLDEGKEAYAAPSPKEINQTSLKNLFSGIKADYIFYGHEHKDYCLKSNNTTYYCINTVGLINPGQYIVIDNTNDDIFIENKYIDFDIDEEVHLMDKAGYPYSKAKINTQTKKQ